MGEAFGNGGNGNNAACWSGGEACGASGWMR
jgi:hypothetical protein